MAMFLKIIIVLILVLGGIRLWDSFTDPRRDKEAYRQAKHDQVEWKKCFEKVNPHDSGAVNHHLVLCYCGTSPMDRFLYGKSPYGDKYLYSHPSCKDMGYQDELEKTLNRAPGY